MSGTAPSSLNSIYFDDIKDIYIENGVFRFRFYTFGLKPGESRPSWIPGAEGAAPLSNVSPMAGKALMAIARFALLREKTPEVMLS